MNSARNTSASLYLVNANGTGLQKITRSRRFRYDDWPAWSPDGREIAFARCRPRACAIWARNLRTGVVTRVIGSTADATQPAWSPDGRQIAFTSTAPGGVSIDPSWSPDGRWIAVASQRNGPFNIFAARAVRRGTVKRITYSKLPRNSESPDWGHQP